MQELSDYAPERQWRLVQMDASLADIDAHRSHLLGNQTLQDSQCCHPAPSTMLHYQHEGMDLAIALSGVVSGVGGIIKWEERAALSGAKVQKDL